MKKAKCLTKIWRLPNRWRCSLTRLYWNPYWRNDKCLWNVVKMEETVDNSWRSVACSQNAWCMLLNQLRLAIKYDRSIWYGVSNVYVSNFTNYFITLVIDVVILCIQNTIEEDQKWRPHMARIQTTCVGIFEPRTCVLQRVLLWTILSSSSQLWH